MQIQEFLDALFRRAREEQIEPCEAYLSTGDSFEASVNNGEIIAYSVSSSLGLSFRALINGKMGYASTQALDEAAIEMLITAARDNAQLIESDDEQFIFAGSGDYPKLDTYNPALDKVSAADKLSMVKALEQKAITSDERVKQVGQCFIMSGGGMVRIVNSMGLDVSHRDNMIGAVADTTARDGDKVSSGFDYIVTRDIAALDLDAIAQGSIEDAVSGLEAKPVPSGKYVAAIKNTAMCDLIETFASVFSADDAQKGMSMLRGREGEMIAAECVTLIDDPLLDMGMCGSPFDAEGVRAYKKAVIERGKLTTLLHNLKTAKKDGLSSSTANASKAGYSSPISVAPTNFYIEPGDASFDELLKSVNDGILITELQGLHAGANAISGDFSLSCKGFLIEGGAKTRAVSQITVSGNFYELLKTITAVGSDLKFTFPSSSHFGSPTVMLSGISVAGE